MAVKTYEEQIATYMSHQADFVAFPTKYALEPFHIFGNTYYVGDKKVCVHLMDTGEGLVLLDSGFPQCKHMLVESIYHLGFDPHDIKWIVLTHAHYDHVGAAMDFKRLYGCKLAMSRVDTELMQEKPGMVVREWSPYGKYIELPEIDKMLEDGEHFILGSLDMTCLLASGHTPGTMAFFWESQQEGRTLRLGTFGGAGKGSVTRASLQHHGLPLSLQQTMLDSIAMLKSEHVDIMLGNHPYNNDTLGCRERQLAGEKDAFIDPEKWPRFLEKTEADFRKTFAEEADFYRQ